MIKDYLTWPWILSVPVLLCGFACSVFFTGTDNILFAPFVFCLLSFVCLALYKNFSDGWSIPLNATFLFTVSFWLWIILSSFWSTVPYVSTLFTIIISILPGFFVVSILTAQSQDWVRVHTAVLWVALGLFAIWALIQFYFFYEQYGPRIHHPMLNPNNLSGLFNLGLFPAIGMFFLAKKPKFILLAALAVMAFYMALIVTQSRGGFAACVISLFVFLPFVAFKNPESLPWKKIIFIAVVFCLLPYLSNLSSDGALEKNLIRANVAQDTRSMEDRFYLWESTWNMIKDHFWLGTGLATFYFYYPRYRLPLDRSDGFFAHMDPLQFWAETGFMAPILFYGLLICILLRTIRAIGKAGPNLEKRLKIMAPFCGMLALTGHTHITFHLYMPGMLLPLSAFFAYWYMSTENVLKDENDRLLFKPAFKLKNALIAVFIFIVALTAGWAARISASTYLMAEVQKAASVKDYKKANDKMNVVSRIAPPSYGRYFEYEARFRVGRIWSEAKSMDRDRLQELFDETLHYLDEAQKRNPAFTTLWDLRARTYFAVHGILLPDGQDRAISILKEVVEANPLAVDSRVGLSNVYRARGEIKKAARILEEGVQWPRPKGTPDLNFLIALANLKLQLGDKKAHNLYMEEAKRRAKRYGMVVNR